MVKRLMLMLLGVVGGLALMVASPVRAVELDEAKAARITEKCDQVKNSLVTLQHNDSRTRVYLGRKYETILTNYIKPLNVSLVENNLSTTAFIDNQNNYVAARQNFVIDFIEYQKLLEELVVMDCKTRPVEFYDTLELVRARRKIVAEDVTRMRKLSSEQVDLATALETKL